MSLVSRCKLSASVPYLGLLVGLATLPVRVTAETECIDYGDYLHWISRFDIPHAHAVAIAGDLAYIAEHATDWSRNGGIHVVDISNPPNPAIIGSEELPGLARDVAISGSHAGHPNPFNPHTSLQLEVPIEGPVAVRVYDARGRFERTLVDRLFDPGVHVITWDGRDRDGRESASGTYFVKMVTEHFTDSRSVALVR